MPPPAPTILYEDNHLLVLNKPPLLATMGAEEGMPSLVEWARGYLKEKYQKPGNVYVGVVSRLDSHASGAIVLARTSKAAARLTEAFATNEMAKTYWALVESAPRPAEATLLDWLVKDESQHRVVVVPENSPGAKPARLHYRTVRNYNGTSHLEISLETGRKHQIRVQLSSRGWPVVGDRKYDAASAFPAGIALHSRRLAFEHPVRHTPLDFTAPLPDSWQRWGIED